MTGPAMSGPAMRGPGGAVPQASAAAKLPVEGMMPPLDGAVAWLNSPPLTSQALRGKVVLVDFWTYSCINCLRSIPYVRAWAEKYKDKGLVVIGIHTPEFAFERQTANVKKAAADLGIDYPIAIDNKYQLWRAFNNNYWPAHYFIDAQGRIRHHHFGEGDYDQSERVIQELLAENGVETSSDLAAIDAKGAQAAADVDDMLSPETYIGYEKAENFASPGGFAKDAAKTYADGQPRLNEWGLTGDWTVGAERAVLDKAGGGIVFGFHARDLHLVLRPSEGGAPVRFRVTVDGAPPGDDHGVDVDANGEGVVTEERLYQLVRQHGAVADHTFRIEFLDPGVEAYSFTFG
jgi:thiol-disulfide isomerase/thioredoxin